MRRLFNSLFLDEPGITKLLASDRPAGEISSELGKTMLGQACLLAPAKAGDLSPDYMKTMQRSLDRIRSGGI